MIYNGMSEIPQDWPGLQVTVIVDCQRVVHKTLNIKASFTLSLDDAAPKQPLVIAPTTSAEAAPRMDTDRGNYKDSCVHCCHMLYIADSVPWAWDLPSHALIAGIQISNAPESPFSAQSLSHQWQRKRLSTLIPAWWHSVSVMSGLWWIDCSVLLDARAGWNSLHALMLHSSTG